MEHPYVQVDAFADRAFAGNPAAVYLLPSWRDAEWLQRVALEMNQAETAFLVSRDDGFDLRWFTPTCEVDLCGHATLASAHMLWENGHLDLAVIARFHTRSGILTAVRLEHLIWLDFPSTPAQRLEDLPDLVRALGAPARWIGQTRFDYFVELESEAAVRSLTPDLAEVGRICKRGVIVTAPSATPGIDFVSRFFAPAAGIAEDPATGSSHCALAPYWAERIGRDALTGYQASARGGTVRVRVAGDRVHLGGAAVTVLRGVLSA